VIWIPSLAADYLGVTTGDTWWDFALELVLYWPYYALFHASRWQATPGKRAFGIKVTNLHGTRIGFGRATARYYASILSALPLALGFIIAAFTRRRQALHDILCGTLVVSADTAPGAMAPDYQVMPLPGTVVAAVFGLVFANVLATWAHVYFVPSPSQPIADQGVPVGTVTGPSFELTYALYKFPLFGGDPTLVKEGLRTYGLSDVRVRPGPQGDVSAVKRLEITDGFSIEAHIYREANIDGFGLSVEKQAGFSWEWFDRERDDIFSKRQGPGRIRVRMAEAGGKQEVAEIRFLDDVTLRLDRYFLIPFTADESDHLVVRKGSVLILKAP